MQKVLDQRGCTSQFSVGGGYGKNKRTKRLGLGDIPSGVGPPTSSSGLNAPSSINLAIANPLLHQNPASSMHYRLPNNGNVINLIFAGIQQTARLGDRFSCPIFVTKIWDLANPPRYLQPWFHLFSTAPIQQHSSPLSQALNSCPN